MSLYDILQKFIQEFANSQHVLYDSDDQVLFIVSIINELLDFQNNFSQFKINHLQDSNLRKDLIMEFVLQQHVSDAEKERYYILISFHKKELGNLLQRVSNQMDDQNLYEKYIGLINQLQSIDCEIKSQIINKFEQNQHEQFFLQNVIIDTNDPIYLWQQKQKQQTITPEVRKNRCSMDSIIINDMNFDQDEEKENYNSYFNNIQQIEKILPSMDTTQDNTTPNKTHNKQTNSQLLYIQQFEQTIKYYKFPSQPEEWSLESQNFLCHSCSKSLSKGLYFAFNNCRYCYYTGYWYCTDCIAIDKQPIPYLAVQQFDLKCYNVCKPAQLEIEYLMDKPILEINYDDKIVFQNKQIYEFFVLKRQIHLIYDKICDVQLIHELFRDYLNFALKRNFLSLQNLYEIYNGILTIKLQQYLKYIKKHIEICQDCQKKGKTCMICKNPKKIFHFDLLETSLCDKCNSLYHKQCIENNLCPKCMLD